jgi:hypothetical protein
LLTFFFFFCWIFRRLAFLASMTFRFVAKDRVWIENWDGNGGEATRNVKGVESAAEVLALKAFERPVGGFAPILLLINLLLCDAETESRDICLNRLLVDAIMAALSHWWHRLMLCYLWLRCWQTNYYCYYSVSCELRTRRRWRVSLSVVT